MKSVMAFGYNKWLVSASICHCCPNLHDAKGQEEQLAARWCFEIYVPVPFRVKDIKH